MTDTTERKQKRTAFRLYAMPTTADASARSAGYRFSRIAPAYTLIYTDRRKPQGSLLLGEEDADSLTEDDKRWLLDCNMTIYAEAIVRERPKQVRKIFDLMEQAITEELKGKGEENNVAGDQHTA